jgi:amino acid adenylation domain-containing protein
VLLSAFATLLYRYTSADDLIFGFTVRHQPYIGALDNLVPLRLPANPKMTFDQMLQQVQTSSKENSEHAIPFATLLQSITVERDLSRAPLLQIAFTWAGSVTSQTAAFEHHLPQVPTDMLDLQLVTYMRDDCLHLRFEYDNVIFERESIKRIAEHYTILLHSAVAAPQETLIDLRIMSAAEAETVLKTWNETRVTFPENSCVHQLIEEQVTRTPERIAVISGDSSLTFRELNEKANQVAHYLQSLGLQPDDLVGVHLQRTLDMVITVLAVMKAGAGYVPLDPNFPQDRLSMIVEDARIKVLITHSAIKDRAPHHEGEIVVIDHKHDLIQTFSSQNPTSKVQPHNLMYVIFTSGSTGRPKGVQLEHRSVVNFLVSMQREPGLAEDDVLLAVTTLSFDIAVLELYLPLLTGAKVVIATYEDVLDGRRLLDLIERHKVTLLQATPATWQLLLEAGWKNTPNMTALCGGEILPLELAQKIVERCKALWNMYGPTETTVWSTVEPIRNVKDFISIGHPINNTYIYVLDAANNPTPIGVPGELVIGGDGLARGYFDRPDLTAEKFLPDPFATEPNARMYRTGDVARYLSDGRLQFYGRVDHQVKVRGFRIELGEIETVLGRHSAIKQNVVIVREDQPGNKQLVAYLVSNTGETIKSSELRDYLKPHLPNYMIPSVFVTIDEMPLTPNGKINRRALPQPETDEITAATEYVAPRNPTEERVAQIWAEALKMPRVGVNDNFFELGGHSLMAIRIFTRIEKEFGQNLPLAMLFRAPTLGQFAALLSADTPLPDMNLHPAVVAIQPNGTQTPIFCVGGGIINLNNLARRLGANQPFYALQWSGLDANNILNIKMEEVAATFIAAMKTIQPQGPYYLAGSFTAGMIAVEMARQLTARGEKIAMLAGFDTIIHKETSPTAGQVRPKEKRSAVAKFFGIVRKGPAEFWMHFTDPIYWDKIRHQVWKVGVKFYTAVKRPIPLWMRSGIYEEFFIRRVTNKYRPEQGYAGDLQLYLTPHYNEKYGVLPKYGWSNWIAGAVQVRETPGDPCTIMLDPNVEHLAKLFKKQLEQEQ